MSFFYISIINKGQEYSPRKTRHEYYADGIEFHASNLDISAKLAKGRADTLYVENEQDNTPCSFVLVFGWCFLQSKTDALLSTKDIRSILKAHREGTLEKKILELGGQFTLISYNHSDQTLWCVCDEWAQHGFHFASSQERIVISSSAGEIANTLKRKINGWAYCSLIRKTNIAPGESLFANVSRITPGKSVFVKIPEGTASIVETNDIIKAVVKSSFSDAVDRAVALVTSSCLRAAKLKNIAVDLTGGHDTRITASVLSSPDGLLYSRDMVFRTHQAEDHADSKIACQIADQFNWNFRRINRGYDISHADCDLLNETVRLSDGRRSPTSLAVKLLTQQHNWSDCTYLWGSLGGEIFRDYFWRHELFKMGVSKCVNYNALFKHRLYASTATDLSKVTNGAISLREHDEHIISSYRKIGEMASDQQNVYKLDRIYLHKLMFNADYWEYSPYASKVLPLLSSEIIGMNLSTPWRHRAGRRLVKALLADIQPMLAEIPHDTGAPMAPLNWITAKDYIRYGIHYGFDMVNRHYMGRHVKSRNNYSENANPRIPGGWMNILSEAHMNSIPLSKKDLIRKASSDIEINELEMRLLLIGLKNNYPDIQYELDFSEQSMSGL